MQVMFDRILSLRVNDVMARDPISVEISDSMNDVSQTFARHGIHCAPVVDESGKCVGIISASDFVKRNQIFAQANGQPHEIVHGEEGIEMEPRSYDNVAECMTQGIQAIDSSMPLITAARIMTEAHLHTIPVVEHHQPVGILSNLDVVAALVNAFDETKNSM